MVQLVEKESLRMSNFVVLRDGSAIVTKTQPLTINFLLPENTNIASATMIQYRLLHNQAQSVDFRVTANDGYWEQTNNFQGTSWHTFHNVLKAGAFKKGNNKVTFSISDGIGDVSVEEVMVLFQQT